MPRSFITLLLVIFLVIEVTEGTSNKESLIKKKEDTRTFSISEIVNKNTIKPMIYDHLRPYDIYKFFKSYATIQSDQNLSKQIENLHRDLAVACRVYWFFTATKFLYSHWRSFLMNEPTIKMNDARLVYQINKFVPVDPRIRFSESFLSLCKLMLYVRNLPPREAVSFFQQYQKTYQFWCVCPQHTLPLWEPANYTLENITEWPSVEKVNAVGYCMYSATLRFLLARFYSLKNVIMDFWIEKIPVNIGITLRDPSITPKTNNKLFFSFLLMNESTFYEVGIHFYEQRNDKWFSFVIYDYTGMFPLWLHCQTDGQSRVQSYSFELMRPDKKYANYWRVVERGHYDIEVIN